MRHGCITTSRGDPTGNGLASLASPLSLSFLSLASRFSFLISLLFFLVSSLSPYLLSSLSFFLFSRLSPLSSFFFSLSLFFLSPLFLFDGELDKGSKKRKKKTGKRYISFIFIG